MLGEHINLYVGFTNTCGKGVFTSVDIRKGQKVFTWKGKKKKGNYRWNQGLRWLQIGLHEWIAPFRNSPGFYMNHSCEPNVANVNIIEFVALKNIKRGEEVTFDYATNTDEDGWHLICRCESKKCRGIISSYKYLPLELKRKYGGFISEYLK